MTQKSALITGITGQDGAYLAELLLNKGYVVHGIKRRTSLFNTARIDHLYQDPHVDDRNFILHHGDMTDSSSLVRVIEESQPDEVYNLAAQSHVAVSFEEPEYTAQSDALGTLRLLESLRTLKLLDGKLDFIKPLLPRCLVRSKRFLRKKPRHFTHVRLMGLPKCMPTGLRSTTESPTTRLLATGSF